MNVSQAVASRRSVRAFLDKPVDREALVRVLDKARRAPSGGNVQPWHGVVVAGEGLKSLIATVAAKMGEGSPEYDIYPAGLPEPYKARRSGCAEEMYAAIGIVSRTSDVSEYYVAGRRIPAFFNGMATGADWMSAASFIGLAGTLYLSGFQGLACVIGGTGGFVLVALLLPSYLLRFG